MRETNAMEAVVGWLDAMRRGDLAAAAEWFHPRATWRCLPVDAVCRDREEILEMLGGSLIPCSEDPASYELEPGLRGAEAVELLTPDAETVVLGAKVPGLTEAGDVPLHGQLFNVFRVQGGGSSRSRTTPGARRRWRRAERRRPRGGRHVVCRCVC